MQPGGAPGRPVVAAGEAAPTGQWLDLARGIAMAIVLYGHFLEVFFLQRPDGTFFGAAFVQYKVLAAFAMAAFFFLSGASAPRLHLKGWRNVLKTSLYLVALAYLAHGLGLIGKLAEALIGGRDLGDFAWEAVRATLKGHGFSIIVVWFLVTLAAVRLIAFFVMRGGKIAGWAALAGLVAMSFFIPYLPNLFGLKSWFGSAVFFLLGMLAAERLRRVPDWLWLPLLPLVAMLAMVNGGCLGDPFARCAAAGLQGETAVWLHTGQIGFVPLFFATGALGCLLVLSLARRIAVTSVAPVLARVGRRSLDILIVNGFFLVFVQPHLTALPATAVTALVFPLLPAVLIALHLGAVRLLERPLAGLNRLALRLADLAMRLLESILQRWHDPRPMRPAHHAADPAG